MAGDFTSKLVNIFNIDKSNSLKHIKNEIIEFLNIKNINKIDYKSVGVLFGLHYGVDYNNNHNLIDLLIEYKYDFYYIRQFTKELICFICNRKIATTHDIIHIFEFFSNDTYDINNSIFRSNDKKKFNILRNKIWYILYTQEKEKIDYNIKKNENNNMNTSCDYNICYNQTNKKETLIAKKLESNMSAKESVHITDSTEKQLLLPVSQKNTKQPDEFVEPNAPKKLKEKKKKKSKQLKPTWSSIVSSGPCPVKSDNSLQPPPSVNEKTTQQFKLVCQENSAKKVETYNPYNLLISKDEEEYESDGGGYFYNNEHDNHWSGSEKQHDDDEWYDDEEYESHELSVNPPYTKSYLYSSTGALSSNPGYGNMVKLTMGVTKHNSS